MDQMQPPTCQSCLELKNTLMKVQSRLIKGHALTLCQSCKEKRFEPRGIVCLALNQFGAQYKNMQEVLNEHLYYGVEILAKEAL